MAALRYIISVEGSLPFYNQLVEYMINKVMVSKNNMLFFFLPTKYCQGKKN